MNLKVASKIGRWIEKKFNDDKNLTAKELMDKLGVGNSKFYDLLRREADLWTNREMKILEEYIGEAYPQHLENQAQEPPSAYKQRKEQDYLNIVKKQHDCLIKELEAVRDDKSFLKERQKELEKQLSALVSVIENLSRK